MLATVDREQVLRTVADLLATLANLRPEDRGLVESGYPPCHGLHDQLDAIEAAANRLKGAIGADGDLGKHPIEQTCRPTWANWRDGFSNVDCSRLDREAYKILAAAAVDLSGFAADSLLPEFMYSRGLRLLGLGLRGLRGETVRIDPDDEYRVISESRGYYAIRHVDVPGEVKSLVRSSKKDIEAMAATLGQQPAGNPAAPIVKGKQKTGSYLGNPARSAPAREILAVLAEARSPMTGEEIAKKTGRGVQVVRNHASVMVESGMIGKPDGGGYKILPAGKKALKDAQKSLSTRRTA